MEVPGQMMCKGVIPQYNSKDKLVVVAPLSCFPESKSPSVPLLEKGEEGTPSEMKKALHQR
jgi:hypothetical protein